jgi:hypothetical protein
MPDIKPAFQVKKLLNRKVMVKEYKVVKDKETGRSTLEMREVEKVYPESFMVYMPSGHAVWAENEAHMRTMGLIDENRLVDMDTGLPYTADGNMDLEALVNRNTRNAEV